MLDKLDGVILEAPFLNASQAGKDYHLSKLLNNNRWSQQKTDESLEVIGIRFNSDKKYLIFILNVCHMRLS